MKYTISTDYFLRMFEVANICKVTLENLSKVRFNDLFIHKSIIFKPQIHEFDITK